MKRIECQPTENTSDLVEQHLSKGRRCFESDSKSDLMVQGFRRHC